MEDEDKVEYIADEEAEGTARARDLLGQIEANGEVLPEKGGGQGIWILVLTIILFTGVDLVGNKLLDVAILVGVLLIHELGHYFCMSLFGYRDLQIFFIPGFGAAAAGLKPIAPTWQRAIVSLAGPLPSLFFGYLLGLLGWALKVNLLWQLALVFIFLNAFNLLPFHPLDGGRFLNDVLLRRNRFLEVLGRLAGIIGLTLLAILFESWILGLVALSMLATLSETWQVASVSDALRGIFDPSTKEREQEKPPRKYALEIIEAQLCNSEAPLTLGVYQRRMNSIWQRLVLAPPKLFPSIALFSLYIGAVLSVLVIPILGMFVLVEEREIVLNPPQSGVVRQVLFERVGNLQWKFGLDKEGLLHGTCEAKWLPTCRDPIFQGEFNHGRFDGTWKYYATDGKCLQRVEYKDGSPCRWTAKDSTGIWKEHEVTKDDKKMLRHISLSTSLEATKVTEHGVSTFHNLRETINGLLYRSPPPPLLFL